MSIYLLWLFLFLSFFILYLGAELSLNSSIKVGEKLKLSPLTIGIFLIGFGTSMPEFFVSQLASSRGNYDISFGNIIGSNIGNIFLILGFAILLSPIKLSSRETKCSVIFHLVFTLILGIILILLKEINLFSLTILFILFGFYIKINYDTKRKKSNQKQEQELTPEKSLESKKRRHPLIIFLTLILGLTLLYAGGELLVYAGSKICLDMGISQYFISAVVIALGTSFPELATALLAIYKKHPTDFIFGNIIGSNLFNIAFVLGSLGVYKIPVTRNFSIEILSLGLASLFFIWANKKELSLGKKLGGILLLIYTALIIYWNS